MTLPTRRKTGSIHVPSLCHDDVNLQPDCMPALRLVYVFVTSYKTIHITKQVEMQTVGHAISLNLCSPAISSVHSLSF